MADKSKEVKRGFFKKLFEKFEKLDKEIEKKSKMGSCCCPGKDSNKKSCCS